MTKALFVSVLTLLAAAKVHAADGIALLPSDITLRGSKSTQRVLVMRRQGERLTADLTAKAILRSTNPKVATIDPNGNVRPVGDGTAQIIATTGGTNTKASVKVASVKVAGFKQPSPWSFTNHVQPILTKMGCNSGACHGAAAGKGGLKLSLRGFDHDGDYETLTRQAGARRIVVSAPAKSLMLQKASMTLPHGGGQRFKTNSREYAVIAQWIAAGCAPPSPKDEPLDRLQVFPEQARLPLGQSTQVLVRAVFASGRTEDVTPWVKFGSSDEPVVGVEDGGKATVKSSGEAAVTVYYKSRVTFARIGSPYPKPVPSEAYAKAERRNFIDDLVLEKQKELNLPPAPLCTDDEFLRRAFLDTAGILPTPEEGQAFLADTSPDKREKLIEKLLVRPEFVDYWTYKWSDLLLVSSRKLPAKGMWAFNQWIRESVAKNKPWDQFAREILTANGSTLHNGAANYFVLHKDTIDLTETTSQAFLGMSITCARCHNHPLEKWTQNEYYGFANLFARVRMKNGDLPTETLVYSSEAGDINHPRLGVPVPPKPLDAAPMGLDSPEDRRARLAQWLTAPENPYFARAFVNRVWRSYYGRGLVEAEDDLRLTNPPSNEKLMAAVTKDFTNNGFDIRRLMRNILNSATYQRTSTVPAGAPSDPRYYATYLPRRLPAEVMLDAIAQATSVPTAFPGYPAGTRALQLVDSTVASYFLDAFGRPQRMQTCSCERQEEPSVAQALHLANGDTINSKLRAKGGIVEILAASNLTNEQLLERLYLQCFARKPKAAERERLLSVLRDTPAGERRDVIEDLLAAMLTTKEFLFNH